MLGKKKKPLTDLNKVADDIARELLKATQATTPATTTPLSAPRAYPSTSTIKIVGNTSHATPTDLGTLNLGVVNTDPLTIQVHHNHNGVDHDYRITFHNEGDIDIEIDGQPADTRRGTTTEYTDIQHRIRDTGKLF